MRSWRCHELRLLEDRSRVLGFQAASRIQANSRNPAQSKKSTVPILLGINDPDHSCRCTALRIGSYGGHETEATETGQCRAGHDAIDGRVILEEPQGIPAIVDRKHIRVADAGEQSTQVTPDTRITVGDEDAAGAVSMRHGYLHGKNDALPSRSKAESI